MAGRVALALGCGVLGSLLFGGSHYQAAPPQRLADYLALSPVSLRVAEAEKRRTEERAVVLFALPPGRRVEEIQENRYGTVRLFGHDLRGEWTIHRTQKWGGCTEIHSFGQAFSPSYGLKELETRCSWQMDSAGRVFSDGAIPMGDRLLALGLPFRWVFFRMESPGEKKTRLLAFDPDNAKLQQIGELVWEARKEPSPDHVAPYERQLSRQLEYLQSLFPESLPSGPVTAGALSRPWLFRLMALQEEKPAPSPSRLREEQRARKWEAFLHQVTERCWQLELEFGYEKEFFVLFPSRNKEGLSLKLMGRNSGMLGGSYLLRRSELDLMESFDQRQGSLLLKFERPTGIFRTELGLSTLLRDYQGSQAIHFPGASARNLAGTEGKGGRLHWKKEIRPACAVYVQQLAQ